jgi:putative MATE family efflux protein
MAAVPEALQEEIVHENPTKIVWTLAWPVVALYSLQVVNNLLDTGFVGRLHPAAMTAHGASLPVVFLLFQVAFALSIAATALVSRAYGAEDHAQVKQANRQCLSLSILSGFLLAGVCALLALVIPNVIIPAHNEEARRLLAGYLTIYSLSLPALHIIQAFAGALRGVGDTKSPMTISGVQILLHIALNYILIFPPRHLSFGVTIPGAGLGLLGAAAAFAISAWLSALVYMAYSKRTVFGSLWRLARPRMEWIERILRIATPAAVMGVVRTGSLFVFMLVLARVPDASQALAAVRGGFAIESIMFMPGMGLSMAAATLVGQSLGMRRPERAERLAWTAAHHSAGVILALCIPIFAFAPQIAGTLIKSDPQIAQEMTVMIRFMCTTEVLFGYSMVMSGAMQGAGDTVRPMWISIVSLWGVRLPLAWILAITLAMGATGAWIAMALTQGLAGALGIWLFKRGAWKQVKV